MKLWPGNYSAYTVARELHLQRHRRLHVTQQKEIARLEEAIKRFERWAHMTEDVRHARQARCKRKQVERMEKVERPVLERRKMRLELRSGSRGGQKVVELRNATIAFDEDPVLLDVDLAVMRGERVGVSGGNGAGKSALIKTMSGQIEPVWGESWVGPSIKIGYLAQDQELLPPNATPIDLVRETKPVYEDEAVKLLLRFLFRYDRMREPANRLSGGERTRLELLLLMLEGSNFLVLDEPTNHLDIDSLEVLENALENYDGTVVFVSHDRYFLDRMADRILEVRDGAVLSHEGGYSAWREKMENVVDLDARRRP
ncbi:MAG: ABC-F family ATP-binding cassette domain-containing protein [Rubrobacteraceae bacterium]